MKLTLRQQLTQFAHLLQNELFPVLEETTGELDSTARRLVATLEMIPLSRFVPSSRGWNGRPSKDRYAVACAFAKNYTRRHQCFRYEKEYNDSLLPRF